MPANFFKYLNGEIPLPTLPREEVEGYLECKTCFAVSKAGEMIDGFVYWICPSGHHNKEKP